MANSRWFADVAGREIAAVVTQLPAQAAQMAFVRGQAADLWQAAAECLETLSIEFGPDEKSVVDLVDDSSAQDGP